jgi:hypothetical protein
MLRNHKWAIHVKFKFGGHEYLLGERVRVCVDASALPPRECRELLRLEEVGKRPGDVCVNAPGELYIVVTGERHDRQGVPHHIRVAGLGLHNSYGIKYHA